MAILPAKIQAGTTLDIKATVDLYPPPTYTLEIALVSSTARKIIASTDNADGRHAIDVSAGGTTLWAAGVYSYQVTAVNGEDRYPVERGTVEILPNLSAAAAGLDTRTPARIILDAVNAILAGVSTESVRRIKWRDRELESYDLADLLKLRDAVRAEVAREDAAVKVAAGLPNPSRAVIRFGRPI